MAFRNLRCTGGRQEKNLQFLMIPHSSVGYPEGVASRIGSAGIILLIIPAVAAPAGCILLGSPLTFRTYSTRIVSCLHPSVASESLSNAPRSICPLVAPDLVRPSLGTPHLPPSPPPRRQTVHVSTSELLSFSAFSFQLGEVRVFQKKKVTSLFYSTFRRRDLSKKESHI